jgi:F-box protein 21
MTDERKNYRNLRNTLIGHALSEDDHQSLPIISSALFCCVAERLGMTSSCVSIPGHVHAAVFARPGFDLDGGRVDDTDPEQQSMYLNPYGSGDEVNASELRSTLVETGWSSDTDHFLKPSPVPLIVMRTAQNIKASYSRAYTIPSDDDVLETMQLRRLRTGLPELNLESAAYAAMWAEMLMKQPSNDQWDAILDPFLNRFALSFSEDAWIVEKHLLPRYDAFVRLHPQPHNRFGWENVREILGMLVNLDTRHPKVNRRYTEDIRKHVHFKIGQVFRHKRYNYIGIINGWATGGADTLPTPHYSSPVEVAEEDNEESWLEGRRQNRTYYTCL